MNVLSWLRHVSVPPPVPPAPVPPPVVDAPSAAGEAWIEYLRQRTDDLAWPWERHPR